MYLRFVILQKFDSMFTFQMSNMILPDSRTFRSFGIPYLMNMHGKWEEYNLNKMQRRNCNL